MKPAQNIFILSRPVQSGKTSTLMHWCSGRSDVSGFLTPDVGGKRKLFDLESKAYHELEVSEYDASSIAVGKFLFDKNVFAHGRELIRKAIENPPAWFVIDEVGPLEIRHRSGFEPALSEMISHCKSKAQTKLLLVVRDHMLAEFLHRYDL